jgi:hypothetical protein
MEVDFWGVKSRACENSHATEHEMLKHSSENLNFIPQKIFFYLPHSNFFFIEAPKKTSGFRSTEQTVKHMEYEGSIGLVLRKM